MPDREKVIKGLELCEIGYEERCVGTECPYYQSNDCTNELKNDILALLKEHEAVKPKHNPLSPTDWFCGKCGMCISRFHDYCPSCGQAVKWE